MRKTAILMLVLACVLGAGAVFLARDWVQDQLQQAKQVEQKSVNLTSVVVAKRALKFGDKLGPDVLEEASWPVANVPQGSFSKIEDVVGTGERRVVLRGIQINEPVLKTKVSGFGGRATLSTVINKGLRAVTVRVNDVNGVAGFVLPGDRVDILLTRQPTGGKELFTDVLMQNIKVLGIDQEANEDKDKPKVARAVTVEVTGDHSQKLALAQKVGTLSLTLRNAVNTDAITHRRVRVRDLVDDNVAKKKETPVAKAVKKAKTVRRVFRRNTRTSVKVFRGVKATVQEVTPEKASPRRRTSTAPKPATQPKASGTLEKSPPQSVPGEQRPATSGPTPLQPGAVNAKKAPVAPKRPEFKKSIAPVVDGTPISPAPPVRGVETKKLSLGPTTPAEGTNLRYSD